MNAAIVISLSAVPLDNPWVNNPPMELATPSADPENPVFNPKCVRKGTRVWWVGSPPLVPPQAGGGNDPIPVYGEGWGGAVLLPIESICPGDWVLTYDRGPRRVLRLIQRFYRGTMIGVCHDKTDATLWLTEDHKALVKPRPRTLGGQRDWSGIPSSLHGRSQTLRREMTPPEQKLWQALRNKRIGYKFRRQHPIGRYIADFYCREARLVVEVDGALAHGSFEAMVHDKQRDEYLQALGLRVLRIPAKEVETNLEGVFWKIHLACEEQMSSTGAVWVEARDLRAGDVVFFGLERIGVPIREIRVEGCEEIVYDLEVEMAYSFVTEVCVVHNCSSGLPRILSAKSDHCC